MQKVVASGIIAFAVLSVCVQGRFYTYSVRQQLLADSLHVIDSIQTADSTRRADSMMIERYASSDEKNIEQVRKEAEKAKADDSARKAVIPIKESEQDIYSSRSVVITEGDTYAEAIDSIQRVIDSIHSVLYREGDHFKKMERFPFDEKKRYLRYLIQNSIKDTVQVVSWCEQMHGMLELEQTKIRLILKTQQNENTRSFLMGHLKKTQDKLGLWSNLMVSLASSQEKTKWKPVNRQ